jgi:hypothetical protein
VYFDLQQANIQNSTDQEQQPLKFLETRETPVIANTGDYYMSVARFQLDTYNLPVFVGEPDITQTGTFDPDKTIYKVAMNITNGSFTTTQTGPTPTLYSLASQISETRNISNSFGANVITANTGTKNTICVAVSDGANYNNRGQVFIWKGTTTSSSIAHQLYASSGQAIFLGSAIGISDDGTRVVATSTAGLYLFNIVNGVELTPETAIIEPTLPIGMTAISGNGLYVLAARFFSDSGTARVYNFATQATVGNIILDYIVSYFQRGVSFSTDGIYFITSAWLHDNNNGYVEMRRYDSVSNTWIVAPNQFSTNTGDRLGYAVAMSGNGIYACASAYKPSDTGNYVRVWKRTGTTFTQVTQISTASGQSGQLWGKSVSMSNDGSTITVTNNANRVYVYVREIGVESYSLLDNNYISPPTSITGSISISKTVSSFYVASSTGQIYQYTIPDPIPAGTVIPIPSTLSSVPTIESVKWIKSINSASAPTQNSLTGKNTALYQYYYCNSYNSFIVMVNKTLKLAYKNFIERIYTNWIAIIADTGITNQFLDITAVHYPTPPFLDWNELNLTADAYVTMLFETYQTAANAVIENLNYAMPQTTWAVVSTNNVGTPVKNTPLKFEVAFNAPLYSLFSSFPATTKIITSSTGLKETYYVLNFVSSGLGLITPSPALNSVIPYTFLSSYTNATTGVITIPTANTFNYSHSRLLIKQAQELSTIDTWTPVNAIVFTTTSIPIIVNQFSASSSIGSNPPSSSLDNAFAFIITDLQTNQQGYRPNLLLVPQIQRNIDLTGNQPLKTIDINVFWRTKTGILIPFTLASGATSSIKLLFEKKVLGEKQKISMASVNVRDLQ